MMMMMKLSEPISHVNSQLHIIINVNVFFINIIFIINVNVFFINIIIVIYRSDECSTSNELSQCIVLNEYTGDLT